MYDVTDGESIILIDNQKFITRPELFKTQAYILISS